MVNPYGQIDFVVSYFKERSDLSVDIGKETVWNYVKLTPEKEITRQIFEEIFQRLIDDGYIRESDRSDLQPTYHLTFSGRLFVGYKKEREFLDAEKLRLDNIETQNRRLSYNLNLLTAVIALGTLVAAVYYVLEILNHWFCVYPRN